MNERDKFLTEAMGSKTGYYPTYTDENGTDWVTCRLFKTEQEAFDYYKHKENHSFKPSWCGFNSWVSFGKLWEWAQGQEWWGEFGDKVVYDESDTTHEKHQQWISDLEWFIHPARFADAVYAFLKERK